jgi:hypothetical protein
MKKVLAVLFIVTLWTAVSQAAVIDSFVNADFDAGAVSNPFQGFDAPWAPEIIGWTNYPSGARLNDSGVEGSGAWWGTYQNNSAFMSNPNDAAYNLSSYVIKAGDVFNVSFYAKGWNVDAQWTVTLFYDDPANVIGSFTVNPANGVWNPASNPTPIVATAPSVGGTLGILFKSTGAAFACLDNLIVDVVTFPVAFASPADGAIDVPVDQILSWQVVDTNVSAIDLYFGTDPNLLAGDRRLTGASASTSSWDTQSAGGMDYDQVYYWRIDTYEPNTLGGPDTKTVGPAWNFTTKSFDIAPIVDAGDSVITTLELCTTPNALALNGSVTDDGTSELTVSWEAYELAYGGGLTNKVTFADQTSPDTTVTISESGTYILNLSATDATGTVSDAMEIVVYDSDCDAAKATGTRVANYFDRDDNCVVNILDFAAFALEWLDSTALTESYLHSATVAAGTDNALFAEYWTGISGTDPNALLENSRYPDSPNGSYLVVNQLSGSFSGDNYGQRIRGYIVPQTSGTYTFYIASDDGSRLFLGADATPVDTNPALGNQIAEVPGWGWTNSNQWDKYTEQKSAPVTLTEGQYYYVEILHKEGTGGDNVSVGWSTDGGTTITVVPGAVLRYALP